MFPAGVQVRCGRCPEGGGCDIPGLAVSPLPKRLLGHPWPAVFLGHVDRATSESFGNAFGRQFPASFAAFCEDTLGALELSKRDGPGSRTQTGKLAKPKIDFPASTVGHRLLPRRKDLSLDSLLRRAGISTTRRSGAVYRQCQPDSIARSVTRPLLWDFVGVPSKGQTAYPLFDFSRVHRNKEHSL